MTQIVDCDVTVPPGYVLCLIPQEMADAHRDWRECAAVRIVQHGDGSASFDICDDLEWLTDPEAQK